MESKQQTLRAYKALTDKNRKKIQQITNSVLKQQRLFSPTNTQKLQQIKQQYQSALITSKQSINKNIQLQAQLEYKQDHVRTLKEKLYRQLEQMEGLEVEMKKATGQLKKQRKNWHDANTASSITDKLKSELNKLEKRKAKIEEQDGELKIKQRLKKQAIGKLEEQLKDTQYRIQSEESSENLRIIKLQQEISREKSTIQFLRQPSRKSLTPEKPNLSIDLKSFRKKIQEQRDNQD